MSFSTSSKQSLGGIRDYLKNFRQALTDWKSEHIPGKQELLELTALPFILKPQVRHIYGPKNLDFEIDELIVISVVKNGELYVNSFVDHYLSMGAKHLIFLDNGSTDKTVDLLCEFSNVTVLQTNAPYQKFENTMKWYLADRFSRGRWHLCADIDELFTYPDHEKLSLRDFLRYLNAYKFTAVTAHMLDLFSDLPLSKVESKIDDSLKDKYQYFDLTSITRSDDYWWSKPPKDFNLKAHWGGIRKVLFGTNTGLTKAPLVKLDGKVKPFVQWHHVRSGKLADVSCVLLHYPFVSSFYQKVLDAVETGCRGVFTDEYAIYWKELERNPDLNLKLETAEVLTSLDLLLDQGFIVSSENYRQWVKKHSCHSDVL